jgi:hypothetical protein
MVLFTPIPSASVTIAPTVNNRFRASERAPYLRSENMAGEKANAVPAPLRP